MRKSWQHAVQVAIDESDQNQLELKIQQAEVAIFQRIDTFSSAHDGEEEALFEALRKIRGLTNQFALKII
jgi:3-deoxy-D-manno-octulosonic-acid transferase